MPRLPEEPESVQETFDDVQDTELQLYRWNLVARLRNVVGWGTGCIRMNHVFFDLNNLRQLEKARREVREIFEKARADIESMRTKVEQGSPREREIRDQILKGALAKCADTLDMRSLYRQVMHGYPSDVKVAMAVLDCVINEPMVMETILWAEHHFIPLIELEELADEYIEFDSKVQMKMRNGMTRQMYILWTVVAQFFNENADFLKQLGTDQFGQPTDEALTIICGICAEHYGFSPEELKEAFVRCNGLEFFDADRRAEIEKQWAELMEDEE